MIRHRGRSNVVYVDFSLRNVIPREDIFLPLVECVDSGSIQKILDSQFKHNKNFYLRFCGRDETRGVVTEKYRVYRLNEFRECLEETSFVLFQFFENGRIVRYELN